MKKLIQLQPTAVSRVDIAYCSSLSKTNISCLCSVNYSEKQIKKNHLFLSKDHICMCGSFLVNRQNRREIPWQTKPLFRGRDRRSGPVSA